jgi:glycerol-3-phosphate acyltransferase PlsX
MGGDHAPEPIVRGAINAAREFGIEVVLVGQPDVVNKCLTAHRASLPVVAASEIIRMDDQPAQAVRARRDSSLVVGLRLVRQGEADAFISAGNSGAVMAGALLHLGRVRGIERPAIATPFPTIDNKAAILIDAGANTECEPSNLLEFAYLGVAYVERVFGVKRPRVGLVSNGEEPTKGTDLVKEAHQLLAASDLEFVGNIEGKDIPKHYADVVVTDGFTGNVMLKLAEGVAEFIVGQTRAALTSTWYYSLAGLVAKPAFRKLARRLDHAEFGGAPLLGVNGAVLIAHGRADERAICNGIRAAAQMAREDVVGAIQAHIHGRVERGGAQRGGLRNRIAKTFRHGAPPVDNHAATPPES